ncbi:MAG: DAK2 domain-containing protein, partial [Gaiellaceae bacterium]
MELELVRKLSRAALQNLEAHRRRIDDLNVYPVPDGDTGTNLVLTLRSVVEALDASTAEGSEAVAKELSRAALMGARGNSGVIFSQIVRGFMDVLGGSADVSTPRLRRAFRGASDAAYRAVKRPVEGTMLTVIREM